MSEWTTPWRVVSDDRKYVRTVEHIVSGDVRDPHVARMRFDGDKEYNVTRRRMQDNFQYLEHQAEFRMARIEGCKKAARGDECLVLFIFVGFYDEQATWKPRTRILEDAPAVLK